MDGKSDRWRSMRLEMQQVRADLDAIAIEIARAVEWRGCSPAAVNRLREAITFYDDDRKDDGETWTKERSHDHDG